MMCIGNTAPMPSGNFPSAPSGGGMFGGGNQQSPVDALAQAFSGVQQYNGRGTL